MKFYFMWIADCTGTVFWVDSYAVVEECPVCGKWKAFEEGHCYRVQAEMLMEWERGGREYGRIRERGRRQR